MAESKAESKEKEKHLLETAKVRDLVAGLRERGRVITMDHNITVEEALQKLAENDILSAPVVLAPSVEDSDAGSYLGILDVQAILNFVIERLAPEGLASEQKEKWLDTGADFLKYKLIQVCGSDTDFAYRDYLEYSVLHLITEGFQRADHLPAHRMAISDAHGLLTHIITQSDVIAFLAKHPKSLGELAEQSVTELGLVENPNKRKHGDVGKVVSVKQDTPALDAFQVMYQNKISSVALVDATGVLVGNLSASDLKGVCSKNFSALLKPALEYLSELKKERKLVTVSAASTLTEVLSALATNRIHRVYIVDDKKHAVGIVTLSDLLQALRRLVSKQ